MTEMIFFLRFQVLLGLQKKQPRLHFNLFFYFSSQSILCMSVFYLLTSRVVIHTNQLNVLLFNMMLNAHFTSMSLTDKKIKHFFIMFCFEISKIISFIPVVFKPIFKITALTQLICVNSFYFMKTIIH